MNEPFFCTADEIARAVVASARLFDEDPERIVQGLSGARARWYAFAALLGQFPQADYRAVARGCGFQAEKSGACSIFSSALRLPPQRRRHDRRRRRNRRRTRSHIRLAHDRIEGDAPLFAEVAS